MNKTTKSQTTERPPIPQMIVPGTLCKGPKSEYIQFELKLPLIKLKFMVIIPPNGEKQAPVYIRCRYDWTQDEKPGSKQIGNGPIDE